MRTSIIREVLRSSLHGSAKAVALVLATLADQSRTASISTRSLAALSGFSKRSVADDLAYLAQCHAITSVHGIGKRPSTHRICSDIAHAPHTNTAP